MHGRECWQTDFGVYLMQNITKKLVFLIYNEHEIQINQFSINKYIDVFKEHNFHCVLLTQNNYKQNKEKPICVINRTNNFEIATYFENKGVRVFNNSFVSKICNNKLETYKYLNNVQHLKIIDYKQISFPVVAKNPNGKGGKEVFLLENIQDFNNIYNSKMMLQEFLPNAYDVRTYIIGNESILSIKRNANNGFKANYKINHNAQIYQLNKNEKKMIDEILTKFKFDFVGIDILSNGSSFYFSEIEDSVGSRAVYDLTQIDIIKKYVEYIITQLN